MALNIISGNNVVLYVGVASGEKIKIGTAPEVTVAAKSDTAPSSALAAEQSGNVLPSNPSVSQIIAASELNKQ